MEPLQTIADIQTVFLAEWVLVLDPQTDEANHVQCGRVACHSKDRDEVYRKAIELRPARFAMLYTGRLPKDTEIVLPFAEAA